MEELAPESFRSVDRSNCQGLVILILILVLIVLATVVVVVSIYGNVLGNTVVAHIVYYNLRSSLVAVLVRSFLLQVFRHQEEGHRTLMQILGDAEVTNQV